MVEFLAAIQSFKALLDVFKMAKDTLPDDSPQKAEITMQINAAEKATQLAEAQAAETLGYPLCQCTWPPQIMLRDSKRDVSICGKCGVEWPKDSGEDGPSYVEPYTTY